MPLPGSDEQAGPELSPAPAYGGLQPFKPTELSSATVDSQGLISGVPQPVCAFQGMVSMWSVKV